MVVTGCLVDGGASQLRRRFPQVTPHFFSAPEIMKMVEVSGNSIREVLQALKDAGYRSLPGGGSEILSNRAVSLTISTTNSNRN